MSVVVEATPFPIAQQPLPKADPCVIVIFGALGDLTKRKLVPALIRRDEVEAQWRLITPIAEVWASQEPPDFPNYAAGSEGPAAAEELLARNGHRWSPIGGNPSGCEK